MENNKTQMRHEVIKLTDEAIYPELIKLLESKWEKIRFMSSKLNDISSYNRLQWDEFNGWCLLPIGNSELLTISDLQFIQKYGESTEPEAAPAWSFKTDEELKNFVATFLATKGDFEQFLSSLRKPAFELICQDGVVTDPEQIVYWYTASVSSGKASDMKKWGYRCWISKTEAESHRLNNTPAIKLSDMEFDDSGHNYVISREFAEHLVNERIK